MPRCKKDVTELREMRLKERLKKATEPPSEIYLCVLGNGAHGSPRSLYMFTTYSKYLFNCGEGTQRLAHEYKMKLSKLEHVFITHKSWDNLGGLLGLSLTIQDIGVPQVTLHGPPEIENIYSLTRSFVITKNMAIDKRHHTEGSFSDACMTVDYIPIFSSEAYSKHHHCNNNTTGEFEHKNKRRRISCEGCSDMVVAYVCKGHSKKGKLLIEKCVEEGVPQGPLLGDLKNGKDVTLPSGKTVFSKDVVSPDEPCPIFLVVECPSENFLDPFVCEKKFHAYHSDKDVQLVVHFTPSNILQTSKYQDWIKKFPESTCHLILNDSCSTVNSEAIHRIQHMLNLFHPRIFSLLQEFDPANSGTMSSVDTLSARNEVLARTLDRYHLRPHKGLDRSCCVNIQQEAYVEEAMSTPGFRDSLVDIHNSVKKHSEVASYCDEDYPELVFLGTGSCIPSKVRNVSCILINTSFEFSIILDCGEGSYKQLLRFYGASTTEGVLSKLTCIFISHMHADHHLGLFTILKQRKFAFESLKREFYPVLLIAPQCIRRWLESYDETFESMSSLYRFIESSHLLFDNIQISPDEKQWLLHSCKNSVVTTVPVIHCPNAYGVILDMKEKKQKIVYSGDTVPCEKLIHAGKNCTLLIHEATMEDDLIEEASIKMHSTTSQAIEVSEKMNAKYTILTHFSQRYAKIPLFNKHFQGHIGFAFDNMKVRLCDLPVIPLFVPGLQTLFAEHVEKIQDKGSKRKLKECSSSSDIEVNS